MCESLFHTTANVAEVILVMYPIAHVKNVLIEQNLHKIANKQRARFISFRKSSKSFPFQTSMNVLKRPATIVICTRSVSTPKVPTAVLVALVMQEMVKNAQVNNHRMAKSIFSIILLVPVFLLTVGVAFRFRYCFFLLSPPCICCSFLICCHSYCYSWLMICCLLIIIVYLSKLINSIWQSDWSLSNLRNFRARDLCKSKEYVEIYSCCLMRANFKI